MKKYLRNTLFFGGAVVMFLIAWSVSDDTKINKTLVDFVNPYIGNISHLLVPTYPTIHLPNSMMRVYPERTDFTSDLLDGLPLIITSHRGSSAFNLSPFQGEEKDIKEVVRYSYDNEQITPYSYSVYLDEQNTSVNFSVSHQSAIYELDFEKDDLVYLVINSKNGGINWNGKTLTGYQIIENDTKVYLYMTIDENPEDILELKNNELVKRSSKNYENSNVVLKFTRNTKKLHIKYGISFIDEQQAKQNFERELLDENIASLRTKGRNIWNDALSKIEVQGSNDDDKTVFYTSLYRTFERPVCLSEDGRYYSAFDNSVHQDQGRPFYTDDWIWDSYRAHHPLRILIDAKKEEDIINSFILMAEQMDEFWMPTFPEVTGDSRRMNSNHGVASVIDAYKKGLRGFDLEKAYEACKNGIAEKTLAPWSGMPAGELDAFYKEKGYFPALHPGEEESVPEVHTFESRQPVAVTLGTSYDEWCLAQIAKELGKNEDYRIFLDNSFNYRNLFNQQTHFFHPKDDKGNFIEPFDYKFSGGMGARKFYSENNAWTYRWDVQHNVKDLIDLMGGKVSFVKHLDSTFAEPLGRSKYAFYAQLPDQTGNVGQFTMANEPSLHIPYLYNYAGQPWKTQKRIRTLLKQWFREDLMGIPGDEDGGGMTSFVVFSQLGFYPVTPGMPIYNIGSPVFEHATIHLENGKDFTIIAKNYNQENKYIQSAKLNQKEWNKPWFSHDDIIDGAVLVLTMGDKANKMWGSSAEMAPPSVD
ncbi:GH92 family glycosyl hydrolase [Tamlana fucoidanivorans]|uniref:Glycoside hydrolase family 92 protein n=1 Tax=Allotamlana fucoidanivorans TaxID=2583814 RepID=A0A5C4SLJ4_9FLAO|nr:GH92 family glycosyl hydrolase [Tamlana fucoidanivorans]TNJ44916.1 glycoside hydrolase family 92 protein [Tamlana fucoidanivorans]